MKTWRLIIETGDKWTRDAIIRYIELEMHVKACSDGTD